ncbi:MAG: VCBS repeat-containing protein [Cyclobacteriaceae bacterium]|nr:VCBS repeat-containing protein [Cyclobacteriaceae bacterium]
MANWIYDGLVDIVTCNFNSFANHQITVLLNTGSGTFTGTNKRNFGSSINPSDIAVGDFNKDGNLDVVTCSQTNAEISLLLGSGDGNLGTATSFATGETPRGVAVGDFNNDGNPDVIVSCTGTLRQVYIFLGSGDGNFAAPVIIDVTNVNYVTTGHFNSDTNLDFAVSAGGTVQPWFGNGTGTAFTPGTAVTGFTIAEPVKAYDFDGDGDLDLSSGNAYTLNDGNGNFAVRIGLTQTGSELTVADLNNDGFPDIVARDNTQNYQNVRVFLGNGTGNFTLLAKFETNVNPRSIQVVDVNNDGFLDAVGIGTNATTHSVDILLGDGTGYFSNAIAKFPTAPDPRDMVLGDFNQDGIVDVATSHTVGNFFAVYLGSGNGKFTKTATNHPTGTNPFRIFTTDFNKDNIPDLVSVNSSATASITPFVGQGNGNFTAQANIPVAGNNIRIAIGDFNNDTNPDIVATGGNVASLNFLAGTETGFNTAVTIPISGNALEIRSADFNNDGNLDLALAYSSPNRVVIYFGNGNGTFSEGNQYPMGSGFFEIQDLNNDGRPDINAYTITVGTDDDFYINDGTGVFTGTNFTAGFAGTIKDFEDMNGDGNKDLILGSQLTISSEPGIIRILNGSASGPTTTQLINKQLSGGHKVLARDFNNDSKNDLISVSFNIYEDYFAVLINNTVAVGCPSITTQPVSQSVCEGQNITLTVVATGNAPLSYQWQKDLINIAGATSSTLSLNVIEIGAVGSYTCVVSNACGFVTSNAASISVNPTPEAPLTTSAERCGPGTVVLTALNGTDGNFRWYTQASGGSAIAGAVNNIFTTPALTTTTSYYVANSNGLCESVRTEVIATVHPLPDKPVVNSSSPPIGNTITICSTNSLTLTAPNGFTEYAWSNGLTTQAISVTASDSYSVIVTDANGCTSPASDPLQVIIIPEPCSNQPPVIISALTGLYIEGVVRIDLTPLLSDPDDNLDLGSLRVLNTQTTAGASAAINSSNELILDYGGILFTGIDRISIEVCDLLGVCTQQQLTIQVEGDIIVRTGFSPNGDTRNDFFQIDYIDLFSDTQNNRVTIYNRWGDVVFEISNYDNQTRVFTGLNKNGNELPSGTYFYKLEFKSGRPTKTGYLSLRK